MTNKAVRRTLTFVVIYPDGARTAHPEPGGEGRALAPPPVPDMSLPDFVLARAESYGSRPALIDTDSGQRVTYAQLRACVSGTARRLVERGVRPREVVALCAPTALEFAVTWFAALAAGACVATINPQWTPGETSAQLRRCDARWLFASGAAPDAERLALAALDTSVKEICLVHLSGTSTTLEAVFRQAPSHPAEALPPDTAFLPTSSGTTGLPKTVVLTHRNLVASLCQTRLLHRVTDDDVVLAALPLFHIFGLQIALNLALLKGATVVTLSRFTPDAFLRAVREHGVTRAEVVPPMLVSLAAAQESAPRDLSTLKVLTSGAAPLAGNLAGSCGRRLGCRVKQGYGMTELGGATHLAPDTGPEDPGSIGPALPGVECRVVDLEAGRALGPGESGELLIRTPAAMRGYLHNPQATADTIDAEGWVRTGDIVSIDRAGWYRVTDRAKELIKYKGWPVPPAELESVLLTHPAVADAAVVRCPDPVAGEIPKAFVVLRGPTSEQGLMDWVAGRVAPYKRVRVVEFTDSIPKSPTGKILRRLLVEPGAAVPGAGARGRS